MKDLVYQALMADPEVVAAVTTGGTEARIYSMTALGRAGDMNTLPIPAVPVKPFIIISNMGDTPLEVVRETSFASDVAFRIAVYDDPGDYERINSVLKKVRSAVLPIRDGRIGPLGSKCLESRWTGFSQELQDPDYDANMRFASFVFTASG
jgi:hypothetical protein